MRVFPDPDGGADSPKYRRPCSLRYGETDGGVRRRRGHRQGCLDLQGKNYPFRLIGSVIGPGSVSKLDVSGDIYKLDDISQFPGAYAQGNGQIGLETSGASDLWLENKAGVVMHLTGAQTGLTLSLGRDEVIIEMAK